MAKYIDKDKVIEELKKRIEKYKILHSNSQLNLSKIALKENIVEYYNFLSFLDTLEVKEVDLDNKDKWKNTGGFGSTWDPDSPDYYPD